MTEVLSKVPKDSEKNRHKKIQKKDTKVFNMIEGKNRPQTSLVKNKMSESEVKDVVSDSEPSRKVSTSGLVRKIHSKKMINIMAIMHEDGTVCSKTYNKPCPHDDEHDGEDGRGSS